MSNPVNPSPLPAETAELALTPDVLQRWQNELQAFFSATRHRLRELQLAPPVALVTEMRPPRAPTAGGDQGGDAPAPATHASDVPADRLQELKRRLAAQLANE